MHESDVLYTQNFYGVSFRDADPEYAFALSAILNSSLTAFQLALGGPTWGLERPTVEPHDLLSLRVPPLHKIRRSQLDALLVAERAAAAAPDDTKRLADLDQAVFDLYELEPEECVVASDSVERARHLVFENRKERVGLVVPPQKDALRAYANQVTSTVNAYLRARGERHLEAILYPKNLKQTDWSAGIPGVTAVRFVMQPGASAEQPTVRDGEPGELDELAAMLRGKFDSEVPPYLNERRQLRLYGDKDLFILKPTEMRYWTRTAGLNDADIVLADHWLRRRDDVAHA